MSAFMVEDKTINIVVSKLAYGRDLEWIQRIIKAQGYDLETLQGRQKLADAMFTLNVKGVDARYGENQAEQFRPLDFKYQIEDNYTMIQAYKSLGCWLYQCAEGDNPEESALYKLMNQVKGYLAEHIVSRLPEYEKAPWG